MEYTELPAPVPAAEAIRESDLEIRVPDGAEVTLGPFERQYARAFRIARIETFKDLHTLGLIPRELREDHATEAYRLDERAFRDGGGVTRMRPREAAACGCGGHVEAARPPARRAFQNHLIDALQPFTRSTLAVDHPLVTHTFGQVKAWLALGPRLVGVLALSDVVIGDRATLTNTPTVSVFNARDITIGKEGRLRFLSGGVKVRCRQLNGPPTDFAVPFLPGLSREFIRR